MSKNSETSTLPPFTLAEKKRLVYIASEAISCVKAFHRFVTKGKFEIAKDWDRYTQALAKYNSLLRQLDALVALVAVPQFVRDIAEWQCPHWVDASVWPDYEAQRHKDCMAWFNSLIDAAESAKLQDGLHPPDLLVWKGEHHHLSPLLWRLGTALWGRTPREKENVMDEVWGQENKIKDSTFKAYLSRLNSALSDIGVDFYFSLKNGFVSHL
jgi:hypothetical protein